MSTTATTSQRLEGAAERSSVDQSHSLPRNDESGAISDMSLGPFADSGMLSSLSLKEFPLAQSTSGGSFGHFARRHQSFSSIASGNNTPSVGYYQASALSQLTSMAALQHRRPVVRSTLRGDGPVEKPWLDSKKLHSSERKAYWTFLGGIILGILATAAMFYTAYSSVPRDKYCLVLEDNFDGDLLNTEIWHREVDLSGFGNNQFDWTTDSTNNSYVQDGKLYIVPTLTSDAVGNAAILDGYTLNLTADGRCTASNQSDANCAAVSNATTGVILPPIQSARLTTNFSRTIRYGRVEVRAKLPTGDWLWPAIWMMPKDSVYGEWPRSGEIDIMESKGNMPKSRDDVVANTFRSSLHFGPNWIFDGYSHTTEIRRLWRNYYNQGYHTFGLEWTEEGIYTWERSPVYKVLIHKFNKDFWTLGKFPSMLNNGTLLDNPWARSENPKIAPFDQEFFLILNVAVGGTNGYFEDDKFPNKPWSNSAESARADFWHAKDKWLPSWPEKNEDRAMVVDSVKMWQKC
ncbi:hypothetical protein ACQY0O_000389 [Thecaphora frezii]